jgi:hypothetical protein
MTDAPFFNIRLGRETDYPFILESWQGSHSQTALGREMGPNYVTDQKGLIWDIFGRKTTEIRVAVDREDADAIFGFAVLGHLRALIPRAYYCFVKKDSRRLGIAKALLTDLLDRTCYYTHKPVQRSCDFDDSNGKRVVNAPIDWFDASGVRVFPRDDVPIGEGWSGRHRDPIGIGDLITRPKLWMFSYYRNWEVL